MAPGRLGTLPVFTENIDRHIRKGGFKGNETDIETAKACTNVLRELIGPHLLVRRKEDVACLLPKKTERVLLCPLSPEQERLYCNYIKTNYVYEEEKDGMLTKVMLERPGAFSAIDTLSKICAHPDLLDWVRRGKKLRVSVHDGSGAFVLLY